VGSFDSRDDETARIRARSALPWDRLRSMSIVIPTLQFERAHHFPVEGILPA
jgi:hypothetical protein